MIKKVNIDSLRADKNDDDDDLREKNIKLRNKIRTLERKNNELSSQVGTLKKTWYKTEDYLREITDGIPLKEILKNVEDKTPLQKINDKCPKCYQKKLKRIIFKDFYVISCYNCEYRDRIDEIISTEE